MAPKHDMDIYVLKEGQQRGPYCFESLQAEMQSGRISVEDPVWYDGQADWVALRELFRDLGASPFPTAPTGPPKRHAVAGCTPGFNPNLGQPKFSWWPVSVAGQIVTCVVFDAVFVISAFWKFAALLARLPMLFLFALGMGVLAYLALTGIRFIIFKARHPSEMTRRRQWLPAWLHPATFAAAALLAFTSIVSLFVLQTANSYSLKLDSIVANQGEQDVLHHANTPTKAETDAFAKSILRETSQSQESIKGENMDATEVDRLLEPAKTAIVAMKNQCGAMIVFSTLAFLLLSIVVVYSFSTTISPMLASMPSSSPKAPLPQSSP